MEEKRGENLVNFLNVQTGLIPYSIKNHYINIIIIYFIILLYICMYIVYLQYVCTETCYYSKNSFHPLSTIDCPAPVVRNVATHYTKYLRKYDFVNTLSWKAV
jgi:hypothetical protein